MIRLQFVFLIKIAESLSTLWMAPCFGLELFLFFDEKGSYIVLRLPKAFVKDNQNDDSQVNQRSDNYGHNKFTIVIGKSER